MNKRRIYILLTRLPNFGSKFLTLVTGFYYTHASIGLDEDMNTFYSFVFKGFIVEKINRYVKPHRLPFPCQVYEIYVDEDKYNEIKEYINGFVERKNELKYTKFGVAMCMMGIPFKRKQHFFCSQFVADVLKRCNVKRLGKPTVLYLPHDLNTLLKENIMFKGNHESFLKRFNINKEIG